MINIITQFFTTLIWLTLFLLIFTLLRVQHPIIITIILIIYNIIIFFNLSIWKIRYMFSIILFIIIISGLLIIFIYFSSLISNDQIQFSLNLSSFFIITLLTISLILITHYQINYSSPPNILLQTLSDILSIPKINDSILLSFLLIYSFPHSLLVALSIIYLLITLFIIIKICNITLNKSLRKIN